MLPCWVSAKCCVRESWAVLASALHRPQTVADSGTRSRHETARGSSGCAAAGRSGWSVLQRPMPGALTCRSGGCAVRFCPQPSPCTARYGETACGPAAGNGGLSTPSCKYKFNSDAWLALWCRSACIMIARQMPRPSWRHAGAWAAAAAQALQREHCELDKAHIGATLSSCGRGACRTA